MILPEEREAAVTRALRQAHPYEEPAYDMVPMLPAREQPMGRVGLLPEPMRLEEFARLVDGRLDTRSWAWGDPGKRIRRVAVVGGAADSEWIAAQRADADVLVTGEVKQHVALEASESGMCLLASGHYATEQPGVLALRERLAEAVPDVEWSAFVPEPGRAGRPLG
jgi:putative NIF3 family GTP cyclohydrolase 1 type 2